MKGSIFTVSEVNSYIDKVIKDDFILTRLNVKGEVFNVKYHSLGIVFFTLKDANSSIRCRILEEDLNKDFLIADGMELVVKGKISVSHSSGNYSILIESYEEVGLGLLFREFNETKERLSKKGYLDIGKKREISYCKNIGVITSPTGAVIRDIISVAKRRNPSINIYLFPAIVQGVQAVEEVIRGIRFFNSHFPVDVIIFGRGGGSYEELSVFNDERLCEEVGGSIIPTISAVGHETDVVLTDFVADMRASTPSQAAEIVAEDISVSYKKTISLVNRLNNSINSRLKNEKIILKNNIKDMDISMKHRLYEEQKSFNNLRNKLKEPRYEISNRKSKLYKLNTLLQIAIKDRIYDETKNLERLRYKLELLYKDNILKSKPEIINQYGDIILSIKDLDIKERLNIIFPDGSIMVEVGEIKEGF